MFPSVESITETHENTLGYMLLESAFVSDDFKIINSFDNGKIDFGKEFSVSKAKKDLETQE